MKEAARLLANAERPVIVVDRAARTENGVRLLVELAEALQARVVDMGGRMNFPKTHHLSAGPPAVANADVIIGMELSDFWAVVNGYIDNGEHGIGFNQTKIKPDTKLISINSVELNTKSNYQDFQRFQSVDVSMAADAEATLPSLIEAVKAAIPNDRKAAIEKRGEAAKKAHGRGARAHPAGGGDRLGCEPDQHRAPVDGDLGRRSRTSTGRWSRSPATSATGRIGCGRWRSTITGSAARAATASATARRLRSARALANRESSAASRSRSRATAI